MVIFHHISKRLQDGSQILPINEMQFLAKTFSAGVSIFFVLSGFLLSYPFWVAYLEGRPFPSLRIYAIRRITRIFPGYYLSLTVCFILSLFLVPDLVNPFWRYLSGLTFTSAFNWRTFFPAEINGPLWSIGFEVICYFLLPIAMFILFKSKGDHGFTKAIIYWIMVLVVVLLSNQLIQILCQTDNYRKSWDFGLVGGAKVWWPNYNPIGFFGQYIFGIFAAGFTIMISKSDRQFLSARFNRFDLIAVITSISLVFLLWSVRHKSPFAMSFQNQPYYYPLFPLLAAILLCVLPHSFIIGNLLDNRFFKFTAKVSFGLYIWHNVVLELTKVFIIPVYNHTGMRNFGLWLFISVSAVVISYLFAFLSWTFVENPFVKWAHRKSESIKAYRKLQIVHDIHRIKSRASVTSQSS